jgi:hypothetical protein
MKLLLSFLILFTLQLFGQSTYFIDLEQGQEVRKVAGSYEGYDVGVFPVRIQPSSYFQLYSDTTSTVSTDYIQGAGDVWWRFTITADDTILISHKADFSFDSTFVNAYILFPNEVYKSEPLNVITVPRVYYKTYGSGIPLVRVTLEGF